MIYSDPYVFSWVVLLLEGEIRAASVNSEVLWKHPIIKYAPDVGQERDNG